MLKFLVKLVNWRPSREAHKPSAEEVFKREQKREKELADERETRRLEALREQEWKEVEIPEGQERGSR